MAAASTKEGEYEMSFFPFSRLPPLPELGTSPFSTCESIMVMQMSPPHPQIRSSKNKRCKVRKFTEARRMTGDPSHPDDRIHNQKCQCVHCNKWAPGTILFSSNFAIFFGRFCKHRKSTKHHRTMRQEHWGRRRLGASVVWDVRTNP